MMIYMKFTCKSNRILHSLGIIITERKESEECNTWNNYWPKKALSVIWMV